MNIKVFQKGFNYSQDGPGNRLVYHLQGCNMRCPWCANPESVNKNGMMMVNREWLTDSVCPYGAVRQKCIDRTVCSICLKKPCIYVYKNKGIRYSCEGFEIEAIIDEVMRSSILFYEGGGVTLTGGEPTQQFEAVELLLAALKENGIHTAMETNATHTELGSLFPLIDFLIMDFKHYDHDRHVRMTGIGNALIKANIAKALKTHKNVLIRIPLVKGFNSTVTDIEQFAAFFREQDMHNASFEFLPYHEYGKSKWLQCGMAYAMEDAFVGDEVLVLYEKIFKENNLLVVRT